MNQIIQNLTNGKSGGKTASTAEAKNRQSGIQKKARGSYQKKKGGPLVCPVCEAGFTKSIDVETHMYKHSKNDLIDGLMRCRRSQAKNSNMTGSGSEKSLSSTGHTQTQPLGQHSETINSSSNTVRPVQMKTNVANARNKTPQFEDIKVELNPDWNDGSSTDVMLFKCDICPSEFDDYSKFEAHLGSHKEGKSLKSVDTSDKLRLKSVEKSDKLRCKVCSVKFEHLAELETHLSEVHVGAALAQLGKNATSSVDFESNTKRKLASEPLSSSSMGKKKAMIYGMQEKEAPAAATKKGIHQCHVCSQIFRSVSDYRLHFYCHPGEKPFKCDKCDESFDWPSHKKDHVRLKHGGKWTVKCQLCDQHFANVVSLGNHMLLHTGDRPYACSQCDQGFITEMSLRQHEAMHAKEYESLQCDICKKRFETKTELRYHKNYDHSGGAKMYLCKVCKQEFDCTPKLEAHIMSNHGDTMPFRCTECPKGFETEKQRKAHMLKHPKREQFPCEMCTKIFDRDLTLKRHMIERHEGCVMVHAAKSSKGKATPSKGVYFACDICDKLFQHKASRTRHIKLTHGEDEMDNEEEEEEQTEAIKGEKTKGEIDGGRGARLRNRKSRLRERKVENEGEVDSMEDEEEDGGMKVLIVKQEPMEEVEEEEGEMERDSAEEEDGGMKVLTIKEEPMEEYDDVTD